MAFKFYGITEYGKPYLSEQLETNVQYKLSWGFLEAGAFHNVIIPTSGIYGGNFHRLRPAKDLGYTDGQVWESPRKNWVWETGLERSTQPLRVSGVYINGNFQPATGVGPYAHTLDYWNGRVIFDNAISTTAEVTCEYSYRYVNVYDASTIGDFRKEIQDGSFRVEDTQYLQFGSGSWDTHPRKRIQLPAVIVEAQPQVNRVKGVELGSLRAEVEQYLLCHVWTSNDNDFKQIHDILTYQDGTTIDLFDKNSLINADGLGLMFDGSPNPSGVMYSEMFVQHHWEGKKCIFDKFYSRGYKFTHPPLIYCPITAVCRVNIP